MKSSMPDQFIVEELARVLTRFPMGLRRWSVMHAIRTDREKASRDVPLKFEEEVERVFRRYCAGFGEGKSQTCAESDALFHRPADRAGEVWAVYPERMGKWLEKSLLDS